MSGATTVPWLPTTGAQELAEPNLAEQVAMMLHAERQVMILIIGRDNGRLAGFLADLTHAVSHGDSVLRIKAALDAPEFFALLAGQLGLSVQSLSPAQLATKVGERLKARAPSGHFVLLCEGAHQFSDSLLEAIRQLSNYPIGIVLCGRPRLLRRLARPALGALKQRLNYRLDLDESPFAGRLQWLLVFLVFCGLAYFLARWLAEAPAAKPDIIRPIAGRTASPQPPEPTVRSASAAVPATPPKPAAESEPDVSLVFDPTLKQPPK